MANFIKLTTRLENGIYLRQWVKDEEIVELSQRSDDEGNNEGICILSNGTQLNLIAFNETIDSLK